MKALFAQAPATHNEPAREGTTEVLSLKRQKSRFSELHSAKGNSARGAQHSPNSSLLRKAMLAYFSPRPVLTLGPRKLWAASGSVGTADVLVVS